MAYLKCESPTLASQASPKSYVDANPGGSVATTEQVVTIDFNHTDYNTQITPDGTARTAVMSSSFQIPAASYISGCGVWVDPTSPWSVVTTIIVGDVTTPIVGGPPAGADRWMDKNSNTPSAGGVYFKANWDKVTGNAALTVFVAITASSVAPLNTGNCQVFLKYVEAPRT
jgi:hypothetical protein